MFLIHSYMHLIHSSMISTKETLLTGWDGMSSGEEIWVLKSFRLDLLGLLFSEAFGSSGDFTFTMLMIFLAEEEVKGLVMLTYSMKHWELQLIPLTECKIKSQSWPLLPKRVGELWMKSPIFWRAPSFLPFRLVVESFSFNWLTFFPCTAGVW